MAYILEESLNLLLDTPILSDYTVSGAVQRGATMDYAVLDVVQVGEPYGCERYTGYVKQRRSQGDVRLTRGVSVVTVATNGVRVRLLRAQGGCLRISKWLTKILDLKVMSILFFVDITSVIVFCLLSMLCRQVYGQYKSSIYGSVCAWTYGRLCMGPNQFLLICHVKQGESHV